MSEVRIREARRDDCSTLLALMRELAIYERLEDIFVNDCERLEDSLFGDTHIYGPEAINFYTRGKVVTSRWPDPHTSKVDLGFPQTR